MLGDMGELGPDAAELHRSIGDLARSTGIRRLFCVGALSRETAEGFGKDARWFVSVDEVEQALLAELRPGCNVLIKGSRFMGLDHLVRQIEVMNTANRVGV